jgi:hypothetical protein
MRKLLLIVIGSLLMASCDWPLTGFDPARTYRNPFEARIGTGNVATLQQAWTATLGSEFGDAGNVVIADGVLYTSTTDSAPHGLQAFDARGVKGCGGTPRTCTPLWTAATGGAVGDIGVDNGVIYTTSVGEVRAYDTSGVRL